MAGEGCVGAVSDIGGVNLANHPSNDAVLLPHKLRCFRIRCRPLLCLAHRLLELEAEGLGVLPIDPAGVYLRRHQGAGRRYREDYATASYAGGLSLACCLLRRAAATSSSDIRVNVAGGTRMSTH